MDWNEIDEKSSFIIGEIWVEMCYWIDVANEGSSCELPWSSIQCVNISLRSWKGLRKQEGVSVSIIRNYM
jgi:hypothetical protein